MSFASPFTAPLESPKPGEGAVAPLAVVVRPKWLRWSAIGLLLFGPLAFGGVEPWAIFVLEAGAAVLFLLWLAEFRKTPQMEVVWNPLFLPMFAFLALILVQWIFGLSAYAHATGQDVMLYVAYGLLGFVLTQSLARTDLKESCQILVLFGLALAAFALLQGLAPNGRLYWLRKPAHGGWIYGPYVNHNHYAGLIEMLVPLPVLLAFSKHPERAYRWVLGASAVIMAATVFLSGSRGGMIAFVAEALIMGVLVWRSTKSSRYKYMGLGAVVGFALLVVALGGSTLLHRVASVHQGAEGDVGIDTRMAINRDAVHMFLQKPILGFGTGTFPTVYPQYRSFFTTNFVNAAHNDYMQLAVECGAVGLGLLLWFLVIFYRRAWAGIRSWRSSATGLMRLMALVGVTGILVHSLVDFNLHVPANAAIFFSLCLLGAHPGWGDDTIRPPKKKLRRRRSSSADKSTMGSVNLASNAVPETGAPAVQETAPEVVSDGK